MHSPSRPPLTLQGLLYGARLTLPLLPGVGVFASAFGAAAAQKGMTLAEAVSMSAFVYAGASQMVALEVWRETWSLSTILAIATLTAVVNARMILMGAALQPWLAGAPTSRTVVNLFFLTDANWLLGMRYRAEGGDDHGMLLGVGVALWRGPRLAIPWAVAGVAALAAQALAPGYAFIIAGALAGMLAGVFVDDAR